MREIIFDTETAGLHKDEDRIIAIGAVFERRKIADFSAGAKNGRNERAA